MQQPAAPVTGNTGNTQDTVTTKPDVTEPAATENPVQDEQTKEHHHAWTIPVLSDDKLTVTGYKCVTCGETSHVHTWDIVHKVESGFSAGAVNGWECSKCGETINTADYEELTKANNAASETIKQAWIAKNITESMTDVEKIHKVAEEMHSWSYGPVETYAKPNITRMALCASGNSAFVSYCKAIGIRAEVVNVEPMTGIKDHYMAYVWVDGKQCITDATPTGGFTGPNIWTMDGFDLYCDYRNGILTDEEFDQQIAAYEM